MLQRKGRKAPEVQIMKRFLLLLTILNLLTGCAAPAESVDIAEEAVALADAPVPAGSVVLQPEAPGLQETRCDEAVVDHSHTEDGYVMVRFTAETDKRLKVLLQGPTTRYSYNLTPQEWTVLPLSDGIGHYEAGIYINMVDKN